MAEVLTLEPWRNQKMVANLTKLQKAVIDQLGGDDDEVMDTLRDVNRGGADAGFGGFTYFWDTCAFFEANQAEIVELVKEMADDFDQDAITFVAGFRCLNDDRETRNEIGRCIYGKPLDTETEVPNALAWFALEEVARQLVDD